MIGVKCIMVSVDPMFKLIEMPFILQSQKREVYDHDACIRRLSTRSAFLVAYNNHTNCNDFDILQGFTAWSITRSIFCVTLNIGPIYYQDLKIERDNVDSSFFFWYSWSIVLKFTQCNKIEKRDLLAIVNQCQYFDNIHKFALQMQLK